MKIIEDLKRLKVVEKRMASNALDITKYASILSNERPLFESEDEQRRQVAQLIQANKDLLQESLKIKRRIEITNLFTQVEMGGVMYSISDLLAIKRSLAKRMLDTYDALNTKGTDSRIRNLPQSGDVKVQVIRLFDEKAKNDGRRSWQDLVDNIDSRLEVINATADIIEHYIGPMPTAS